MQIIDVHQLEEASQVRCGRAVCPFFCRLRLIAQLKSDNFVGVCMCISEFFLSLREYPLESFDERVWTNIIKDIWNSMELGSYVGC